MASIQFVLSVPHPGGTVGITDAQRRAAHSHAARIRHAKARRSRTIHHQAQKRDTSQNLEGVKGGTDPQKDTIDLRICRALSAGRKDPFMSFALLLSPLEHWLFDHYVNTIIPLMRCAEADATFSNRMKTLWIPHALAEESLMHAICLASCRQLAVSYTHSEEHHSSFNRLAFQYKLKVLASLRDDIALQAPKFSDSAITKAIMLSYDELYVNDSTMLENHVRGAVKMVELRGGPHTLGMEGMIAHLLSNLLNKFGKEMHILQAIHVPWYALPDTAHA